MISCLPNLQRDNMDTISQPAPCYRQEQLATLEHCQLRSVNLLDVPRVGGSSHNNVIYISVQYLIQSSGSRRGIVNLKMLPGPPTLSTQMSPPCCSTIILQIGSPKPVPPCKRLSECSTCS